MGFLDSSSSSKVIVFDWDDTLCPSSFMDQQGIEAYGDLPQQHQDLFDQIGKCAEKCLSEASKYGEVIIITNSDEGWVNHSAERFVPNLVPVIQNYRIISARTRYERFYPSQPLCWKAAAFAHEVNEIYETKMDLDGSCASLESTDVSESSLGTSESPRGDNNEIISFGDSMEERTATRIVSDQLSAIPKSVMFIASPSPLQILGQLCMLTSYMKYVCEKASSLDLEITPGQAQKCAMSYLHERKSGDHPSLSHTPRRRWIGDSAHCHVRHD